MNGYNYILEKQIAWATNRGIPLVGSKQDRGRLAYTSKLDQNLFEPLLPEVRKSFAAGDGDELGSSGSRGKMQAVHSSSALAVNVFQYWKSHSLVPVIAAACGFCRRGSLTSREIHFEEKYPIDARFGYHPNIDVVIQNKTTASIQRFAIECKFSEAYGAYKHGGLKTKYLDYEGVWSDIPQLRAFAERISPDDRDFKHLHPAQLLKHILGMKLQFGRDGFRLLYLWYDVLGEQGKRHRDEVEDFARFADEDGIKFHALTYQKLIIKLANDFRDEHQKYVQYLTERYL
jgi:hypothetical protein